jgi:hypothetical protein
MSFGNGSARSRSNVEKTPRQLERAAYREARRAARVYKEDGRYGAARERQRNGEGFGKKSRGQSSPDHAPARENVRRRRDLDNGIPSRGDGWSLDIS